MELLLRADAKSIPLADESVQCVVTSPPYWGLRDYGTARWEGGDAGCDHFKLCGGTGAQNLGKSDVAQAANVERSSVPFRDICGKCGAIRVDSQLGLERTPEEYVANMVAVFREVRRVLRPDGTCWVNLGDAYFSTTRHSDWAVRDDYPANQKTGGFANKQSREGRFSVKVSVHETLKPKDLVGIPWRVAFALQADGWWLRQDIIWAKPNPMPESVTDRCTKSHEYVFLLTKSARYFYDAEAVKEPVSGVSLKRAEYGWDCDRPSTKNASMGGEGIHTEKMGTRFVNPSGRNLRSVWHIATQPYKEAHFATFPEKLVEPCILAGTSERGCCGECGKPWERVQERSAGGETVVVSASERFAKTATGRPLMGDNAYTPDELVRGAFSADNGLISKRTLGWQPTCSCGAATKPCVVLDPFAGSGTVGVVCARTGRDFIGLDISEKYLDLARARIGEVPFALPFHEAVGTGGRRER